MERPLNTNDGWEQIVNDVERHNAKVRFHAKREENKRNRLIGEAINLLLCALVSTTLGVTGWLVPWVAVVSSALFLCVACFVCGMVVGRYRK